MPETKDLCLECGEATAEMEGLCKPCWIALVRSLGGNPIAAFLDFDAIKADLDATEAPLDERSTSGIKS